MLVIHLFECKLDSALGARRALVLSVADASPPGFARLPFHRHPTMPFFSLRDRLSAPSIAWRPNLLPPTERCLTYAILAVAAIISPDPAILGEGPVPMSLEELSSWPVDTDWASFGRRRESAVRALRDRAFEAGSEAEVLSDCSLESAAACYLLDVLDLGELWVDC